jgi:hypothetical protein
LGGGHKMGKIIDEKYPDEESEDNEKAKSEYWDIEDRLYEQYKEMKIEEILDEG